MLIQFSVENYLSIKKEIGLSMLASKDNEHEEALIEDRGKRYLKSSVIYGANASGKSNVLNAFWFMVNYVLTSHENSCIRALSVFLLNLTSSPQASRLDLRLSLLLKV